MGMGNFYFIYLLHFPDCQYFYICIGGVSARRNGCTVGLVFNPETLSCDRPRNVAGPCRNWYNDTFLEQHAPAERRRPIGNFLFLSSLRIVTTSTGSDGDAVLAEAVA